MSNKIRRRITINGHRYKVVVKETKRHKRVSVYDDESSSLDRANNTDIIYRKEWKGVFLSYGPDTSTDIETMTKEALQNAVTKIESQKQLGTSMEQKVENGVESVKSVNEDFGLK